MITRQDLLNGGYKKIFDTNRQRNVYIKRIDEGDEIQYYCVVVEYNVPSKEDEDRYSLIVEMQIPLLDNFVIGMNVPVREADSVEQFEHLINKLFTRVEGKTLSSLLDMKVSNLDQLEEIKLEDE